MHAAPLRVDEPARCPKLAENATERQRATEDFASNADRIAHFRPAPVPVDVSRPDLGLAVIGAGVMGRGIAQIAAQAGIRVLLHDSRPGAAREAKDAVSAQLERLREKNRIGPEE